MPLGIQSRKCCSLRTTWVTESKVANSRGFCEHLDQNLLLSASWLWFDFHPLFPWDTSKLDNAEWE